MLYPNKEQEQQKCVIEITSLSSSGEGIGSSSGLKVFVDGALPGENVRVKITDFKKNYAVGKLLSIITPSSDRVIPLCPLFGACGGCQVMHLHYSAQLKLKQKKVDDALTRIGGFLNCEVLPCLPSPHALAYRNKIQLPLIWENGTKRIGLYRKQSHEIIPLDRCLIQSLQGENILSLIAQKLSIPVVRHVLIRNAVFKDESLVILVTNGKSSRELKQFSQELMELDPTIKGVVENIHQGGSNVILSPTFRTLAGRSYIYEQLLGMTFKISSSAFFQVNPWQTENLYAYAMELAQIQSSQIVLDAYCGVGTLAIFAARDACHAYGIESIPHAITDAVENAQLNQVNNCTFFCGKAEELINQFDQLDIVFLNPPRKGCEPEVLNALLRKKADKVIYISCDPATLARDLARLASGYHIKKVQPFDMFPQTMHVETVVYLIPKPI